MAAAASISVLPEVWQALTRVASFNPDLKVVSGGAAVGAVVGALAASALYYLFGGKEQTKTKMAVAGTVGAGLGTVAGGSVACEWIGKSVSQILEEMGSEKRQMLKEVAAEEAKNVGYTIGAEFASRLAREWLISCFKLAFGLLLG